MTPAVARKEFDASTRDRILADHAVVLTALDELGHLATSAEPAFRNRLLVHSDLYTEYSISLRTEYAKGVPTVPISRCPFTNEVLHHSIDTYGLDGLWWDYESPCRPTESVTATFAGLTGALRLGGAIEYAPLLVKPGPPVPFVVPRILEAGAVAVLSQLAIGANTGYAVAYFTQKPLEVPLFNEWGANFYRKYDAGVAGSWDASDDDAMDFDLTPWAERKLLHWIAPNDTNLTLRQGVDSCPYLELPGKRTLQRIQYGTVRTAAPAVK